jgi:hypothetical protein
LIFDQVWDLPTKKRAQKFQIWGLITSKFYFFFQTLHFTKRNRKKFVPQISNIFSSLLLMFVAAGIYFFACSLIFEIIIKSFLSTIFFSLIFLSQIKVFFIRFSSFQSWSNDLSSAINSGIELTFNSKFLCVNKIHWNILNFDWMKNSMIFFRVFPIDWHTQILYNIEREENICVFLSVCKVLGLLIVDFIYVEIFWKALHLMMTK